MQTWKLRLPVLRSWSFGFAVPKLELGTRITLTVFAFLRVIRVFVVNALCRTRSQAPAWECRPGSSSFQSREAGASASRLPSWSLGTRITLTVFAFLRVLRVFVVNALCRTRSQAPAWECRPGSSSFQSREAGASASRFPSWSLGIRKTGVKPL